jgi:hypothetical protein
MLTTLFLVDVLNLSWPSISSTKGSVLSMNPDVSGKSEMDTTVMLKEAGGGGAGDCGKGPVLAGGWLVMEDGPVATCEEDAASRTALRSRVYCFCAWLTGEEGGGGGGGGRQMFGDE